jgi:hypothetical protein
MSRLTSKESTALQAMVRRVGFAKVFDDLAMLAEENDDDQWQALAARLHDLVHEASELE